jgi:hypothetical protein
MLVLRKLYKVQLSSQSFEGILEEKKQKARQLLNLTGEQVSYFAFTGETSNSTYNNDDELIKIETKSGIIKNITEIDDSLVNQTLARAVHKNYICYIQ